MNQETAPMTVSLNRVFRLPHGFMVRFSYSEAAGLAADWHPYLPTIWSPRARRKFLAAYDAARNSFLEEIAQLIGGTVLVTDTNEAGTEIETITTIRPPAVH
jgi:hypothetical protein